MRKDGVVVSVLRDYRMENVYVRADNCGVLCGIRGGIPLHIRKPFQNNRSILGTGQVW